MKRQITRKEFLAKTTKTVVAVSAGAVAASVLPASGGQWGQAGVINTASAAWPWPYSALDREDARKRGHKGYYDGGCCYGAFIAVLAPLAERFGAPYTNVPAQMMYYGAGGGAGWGSLCGALNGAAAAISLFLDRSRATSVVSELFGWYTTAPFPSDISNDYGTQRVFLVNRCDKLLKQTAAASTLCHASVSTWSTASGFKTESSERSERCARLTGDCAAHAVELLNDVSAAKFRATFVTPPSVAACQGCHGSAIQNVRPSVKEDCQRCHKPNWDHRF
jgi:hypothetical protein